MSSLPHIPALRQGLPYESLDTTELVDLGNRQTLALVTQVNRGLIQRDLRQSQNARQALSCLSTKQSVAICQQAAQLFLEAELPLAKGSPLQSPQDYLATLSATTGLPYNLCRSSTGKIHYLLSHMETVLHGLTRGLSLEIFDSSLSQGHDLKVSFYPLADCLGVILPSNSPGVNALWLPAIAMKIPIALKPGREDPWTPYRLLQALLKAGYPPQALNFYPTDHKGAQSILQTCDRSMVFGDDSTVSEYASYPHIKTHGPGRSKILIGRDWVERWPELIDLLVCSIAENSGRSCINTSTIVTPLYGDEIAEALAKKLALIKPLPWAHEKAQLACFSSPATADAIEVQLEEGLAVEGVEEVTDRFRQGPRKLSAHGQNYLLPTILRCHDIKHPLAEREFLFPFASVVQIPQEEILRKIGASLVVTAITDDKAWIGELLRSRKIDHLNLGPIPTTQVPWDQPHEGNLFEFLYRQRAIQQVGEAL